MEHELEHQHGDISGAIAIKFANGQTLDDFCVEHINDYNRDRFEAIAIHLFIGNETIITIYALDKLRQEGTTYDPAKIPVKKFKITTLSATSLFSYCSSLNFTLSTGNYALTDMEVMNK
jgi:hypothetical protein